MKEYRLARRLIRIARMLLAKNWTSEIQRKRPDLDADAVNEIIQGYHNAKKEKMVAYWLLDRKSDLDRNCEFDFFKDEDDIDKAFQMLERQHLDYQKFSCPKEVLNRDDKSTVEISKRITFRPDGEPAFSNKKNLGHGIAVYSVKDDKEGQIATRKAIDANWGYDANPWCLAARKDGFDQDEVERLTEAQKEKLGFYSDDTLSVAWHRWGIYSAYPKRIAFQDGRLLAFSAGSKHDLVQWWNRNDKPFWYIPGTDGLDDQEFLEQYGKKNLSELRRVSQDEFENILMNDENRGDGYCRDEFSSIVVTHDMVNRVLEKSDDDLTVHLVKYCDALSDRELIRIYRKGDLTVRKAFFMVPGGIKKLPATIIDMMLFESGDEIRNEYIYKYKAIHCATANSIRRLYEMAERNGDGGIMKAVVESIKCPKDIIDRVIRGNDDKSAERAIETTMSNQRTTVLGDILEEAMNDNNVRLVARIISKASDYDLIKFKKDDEENKSLKDRVHKFLFVDHPDSIDELMGYLVENSSNSKKFLQSNQELLFSHCSAENAFKAVKVLGGGRMSNESVEIVIKMNDALIDAELLRSHFRDVRFLGGAQLKTLLGRVDGSDQDFFDHCIYDLINRNRSESNFKGLDVPEDALAVMAEKCSEYGRKKLASKLIDDYPPRIVEILVSGGDHDMMIRMAQNQRRISKETGMMMLESGYDDVKKALSTNNYAPPEVLEVLSGSDDIEIRNNIVLNDNLSQDSIRRLYDENEADSKFVVKLARHWNLPPDVASRMVRKAGDEYDYLKFCLFSRNVDKMDSGDIEHVLTHGMSANLERFLASCKRLPDILWQRIIKSTSKRTRLIAASNPGVPQDILDMLAKDGDAEVRKVAMRNPGYRRRV